MIVRTATNCPRCEHARLGAFRYCLNCAFDYEPAPRGPETTIAATTDDVWGRIRSLGVLLRDQPREVLVGLVAAGVVGFLIPFIGRT